MSGISTLSTKAASRLRAFVHQHEHAGVRVRVRVYGWPCLEYDFIADQSLLVWVGIRIRGDGVQVRWDAWCVPPRHRKGFRLSPVLVRAASPLLARAGVGDMESRSKSKRCGGGQKNGDGGMGGGQEQAQEREQEAADVLRGAQPPKQSQAESNKPHELCGRQSE